MKKRLLIGLATIVFLMAIGTLAVKRGLKGALYQGRPVRAWALDLYYSPDQSGRDQAEIALKALGSNAVPELARLLQAKDPVFQKKAWRLAPRLPVNLRAKIFHGLPPPDAAGWHGAAARSLTVIGPAGKAAIPELGRALQETELLVCLDAAAALGRMGKDAVPELVRGLRAKQAIVRKAAAYGLGEAGPDAAPAIPELIQALGDQDGDVRFTAAASLSRIGQPALSALLNAVDQGPGPASEAAATAILRFHPSRQSAVLWLARMARDNQPSARRQAVKILGLITPPDARITNILVSALDDPALDVRSASAEALHRFQSGKATGPQSPQE